MQRWWRKQQYQIKNLTWINNRNYSMVRNFPSKLEKYFSFHQFVHISFHFLRVYWFCFWNLTRYSWYIYINIVSFCTILTSTFVNKWCVFFLLLFIIRKFAFLFLVRKFFSRLFLFYKETSTYFSFFLDIYTVNQRTKYL